MNTILTTICWLSLTTVSMAVTATRAPIVKDGATLDAQAIWLENDVARIAITTNELAGQVMSFVYKPTGHDLTAEKHPQGYCMDRTGENRYFWKTEAEGYNGRIISQDDAAAVAEISYQWNYNHNDVSTRIRVSKTYTLRHGSAALEVTWRFDNQGDAEAQMSPWVKHLGGQHSGILGGPTLMLSPKGSYDPNGEFVEPTTDWVARLSGTETTTALPMVVSTMDYSKIFQQFPWRDKVRFTLETVLNRIHLQPGKSWEITYVLGAMANLGNPTYACPELAAEIQRQDEQVVVHLSPAMLLGERRIEGEVLGADGSLIAKLPNQQANLVPGQVATLTYPFSPIQDGVYTFSLTVFDDGQQVIRLGEMVHSQQSSITLPLVVGEPPAVVYRKWQSGSFSWPTRQPRQLTPWRILHESNGLRAVQVMVPNRIFPEDTFVYHTSQQPGLIQLARGEYECLQVAVELEDKASAEHLTASMEGPEGLRVELREAIYLTTETPSGYKSFPVGQWPDPLFPNGWLTLIPEAPITQTNVAIMRQTGRRIFWLIVKAPRDVVPGLKTGSLVITPAGGASVKLPFQVEVWDITLPKRPALRCSTGMVGFGRPKWQSNLAIMGVSRDEQEAIEHKQSIMDRYRTLILEYGWTPTMFAGLKFWQEYYEVGRGVNVYATGKSKEAEDWLKEKGLLKYAFIYAPFDEHADVVVPEVAKWAREWKQTSEIPVLDCFYGSNVQPLFGLVDIWLGQSTKQPWVEERKKQGDLFFAVNSSLIWHVEFDPLNGRAGFWQDFADGVDGRYVYSTCRWTDDVYQKNWTSGNYMGCAVYPSPDGICTSIRLETMRDGVEDYDYLALLRQGSPDDERLKQDQLNERLSSPEALYRERAAIAKAILMAR